MSPSGMAVSDPRYLSSSEQGLMSALEGGNGTYLNQRDARNLLVVSVSQISEDQFLYSP
jgi:hypothetical protein